jgi:hypothetical protein
MRKPLRNRAARRHCVVVALCLLVCAKAALAGSCAPELMLALTRLSTDPESIEGNPIRNSRYYNRFTSQITLPGAYACEYVRDSHGHSLFVDVECTWIARKYSKGKSIYAELNRILHSCSDVKIETEVEKANGEEETAAEFESKQDSTRNVSIYIEHSGANKYSDIAMREIELSFLVDLKRFNRHGDPRYNDRRGQQGSR